MVCLFRGGLMGRKYTKAQKDASIKYAKENLRRVPLDLKKEDYERLKRIADASGESINGFIKEAIEEKIKRRQ